MNPTAGTVDTYTSAIKAQILKHNSHDVHPIRYAAWLDSGKKDWVGPIPGGGELPVNVGDNMS